MKTSKVGIQIGATTPPEELAPVLREAEQLGFGEIWLAEDYFDLGGIASASTALASTSRSIVGLGVVAAAARHPAVTAMEFATLGSLHPGRFLAGIGHGAPGWVRQMGMQAESPLTLLRETTSATRRLLEGQEITDHGQYFEFDQVRLSHVPSTPPPIYLGVHGPASLRLSGELADGTLLGWFSSPSYVAWARQRIDEGRTNANRSDDHQLVALCLLSISDKDPDSARQEIGLWAKPLLASMIASPQLQNSPVSDDLATWIDQGSQGGLPAEVLDEFVASGEPTTCQATVRRLLDAGADRVVLVPNPAGFRTTTGMLEQIRTASTLLE